MLCPSCNHNQAAKACGNAQCGACCPGGCKHKKHKNGGSSTPAAGTHKEEQEEVVLKSTISSKRSASAVAQAVTPSPVAKKVKVIDDFKKEDGVLGAETKDDEEEGNAAGDQTKIQHEDRAATKEQADPSAEDGDKEESFGDKVIFSFFQKIADMFGDDEYGIEDTLDQYPGLMKATCPEGVNDEWEGMTLFECLCYSQGKGSGGRADARDLMYELVCRGAVATEECYASIAEVGWDHINMDFNAGSDNFWPHAPEIEI